MDAAKHGPTVIVYRPPLPGLSDSDDLGGLLSAIGIAGMDRVMQHNVLAMSGKAVEAAGDVTTLLLDKTGTITLGNRQAVEFIPSGWRFPNPSDWQDAAQLFESGG